MPASSTTHLLLQDVEHELGTTRRVLERVPTDKMSWRPHPKSWTLGQLATHVARLHLWGTMTAEAPSVDVAGFPEGGGPVAESAEALLALFDTESARMRAALAEMLGGDADAALQARWALRHGEHELMAFPRAFALRAFVFNHLVHHRGQLSVYLRLLDIPVPAMYGPSADER